MATLLVYVAMPSLCVLSEHYDALVGWPIWHLARVQDHQIADLIDRTCLHGYTSDCTSPGAVVSRLGKKWETQSYAG